MTNVTTTSTPSTAVLLNNIRKQLFEVTALNIGPSTIDLLRAIYHLNLVYAIVLT
jgi:hypothetical protein